jgi:hypothetical protein
MRRSCRCAARDQSLGIAAAPLHPLHIIFWRRRRSARLARLLPGRTGPNSIKLPVSSSTIQARARLQDFATGGRKDVLDTTKRIIAPLQQFGVTELKTDMEWGTDHFDFMLEGVPTFVADQEEANYLENYHAVSDTYDKVDFAQLKKHVAEAAEFSFALANLPEKIGPRFTRAQIEQSMHETGSDQMFKAAGMWDAWESGNLGRQK